MLCSFPAEYPEGSSLPSTAHGSLSRGMSANQRRGRAGARITAHGEGATGGTA